MNGSEVDTNNDSKTGTANAQDGKNAVIQVKNIKDGDGWDCVRKMTVDGETVKLIPADEEGIVYSYTLENVSEDHTIVVTYEWSSGLIAPEEPIVKPAGAHDVQFKTSPEKLPVFTVGSETSPIFEGTRTGGEALPVSFKVAETYHDNSTWAYYKLQRVESESGTLTPGTNGTYSVNSAATVTATYEKLSWGLHYDGDNTKASLAEAADVPTLTFSAKQWEVLSEISWWPFRNTSMSKRFGCGSN